MSRFFSLLLTISLLQCGSATIDIPVSTETGTIVPATPAAEVYNDRIDSLIDASIRDGAFPGASVVIGRGNHIFFEKGYGTFTYEGGPTVTPDTRFDLASLTKVIGTTTAIMRLYEEGKLDLEARVADYLPGFANNGKQNITVRHLITHTGGLKPFYPFHTMGKLTRQEVLDFIFQDKTYYTPGSDMQYSDLDMIFMALVVEQITGQSIDDYLRENFWTPLGMPNTGFRPAGGEGVDSTVAPTERDNLFRKRVMQGEVHDEAAWILGGTAGHAGLFSSASDLAHFASMMAQKGSYRNQVYFRPETVRLFTTAVDPGSHTRALGWDTRSRSGYSSAGTRFGKNSFGHTGFTGTSIWVDPDNRFFVILLTNRVYPTRENRKISAVRSKLADLAWDEFSSAPIPEADNERKSDW